MLIINQKLNAHGEHIENIMTTNIAFYGSHNAAYAIERDGEILAVVEMERLIGAKNMGLAQYKVPQDGAILWMAEYIPKFLMKQFNIDEFDTCYVQNNEVWMEEGNVDLSKFIPAKNYVKKLHHQAHGAGCFYQSPYENALVFSFDGGGNDGMFNIYLANRKTGLKLLKQVINPVFNYSHFSYNLGFSYMVFAHYLDDIKQESLDNGNLVYPGKLMGLASYGKVRDGWIPYFMQFYKNDPEGHNYFNWIKILQDRINVDYTRMGLPLLEFDEHNRFKGQIAYDIAATSQKVFEDCFLEIAEPYFNEYPDLPICMTGGCALNIILNTLIATKYNKEVFVGPNPNDCGIAAGMLLDEIKPAHQVDLTYSGLPLLGMDMLMQHLDPPSTRIRASNLDIKELASKIYEGNIVGVARGRAEHGPRALGNRSILCNPSISDMKDKLNSKVKNREWYRPFAPVVRLEDVSKYFNWDRESRWMSFCPEVREEWREQLTAITHIDGTARVQTVTREQNQFLYDLLTEFEKLSGFGVLLNTSFNVNGKPLVTTVSDAFKVFYDTEMDGVVVEDLFVTKRT